MNAKIDFFEVVDSKEIYPQSTINELLKLNNYLSNLTLYTGVLNFSVSFFDYF